MGAAFLIFLGAASLWGLGDIDNFGQDQKENEIVSLYLTLGEGCVMFITGLVGCWALVCTNKCMMYMVRNKNG